MNQKMKLKKIAGTIIKKRKKCKINRTILN